MCQKEILELFSGDFGKQYSAKQLSEMLDIADTSVARCCMKLVKFGFLDATIQMRKSPRVTYKLKNNSL